MLGKKRARHAIVCQVKVAVEGEITDEALVPPLA